ncbi:MAG: DUF5714 domain-containing protein [Syntrophomonas sp.]
MYFAKNNIIIPFENTKDQVYAILNPLSGSFDLLNQQEHEQITAGKPEELNREMADYMLERGYLFADRAQEDELVQKKWELFEKETADTQTQLLLIPSYGCNIACTYCYQAGVQTEAGLISPDAVDAFFAYAEATFGGNRKKPFITLFGGEPFINSPRHREIISLIIDRCVEYGYEVAAVTNGYDLIDYIDILARAQVKEIQVTLDGSRQIHDQRRIFKNGKGTFDRIVMGIEAALKQGISINLRSVVDQENLADMVDFAHFLDSKGWLDLPPELFKTQIGRNYELFECYAKPQHLLSEAELWRGLWKMSLKHPLLKKFHRPEFKGIRHLVDTGEMYMASFDTCPAAKTEWVFDLHGDIYGCTASCGRQEYKLGTFFPEVALKNEEVTQWQLRNVNNIEECKDCRFNVVCGGGCGVIAANRQGKILSPDCRPIQDLLNIGVNYYQKEILDLAHADIKESSIIINEQAAACLTSVSPFESGCCDCHDCNELSDNRDKFVSGCMVCGAELLYRDTKQPVQCAICGKQEKSVVSCKNGHYICDQCHSQNILGQVFNLCSQTDSGDPIAILNKMFEIPRLHMHGPEYHSMVPAAIVTAYANRKGLDKTLMLNEAIARGQEVKGGSCGLHGICGAAAGAGIAYSIINDVSPLSGEARGAAMKLTAAVLTEMSKYGGPRCCKRESTLALETAINFIDEFPGEQLTHYKCTQFRNNPECLKMACPYFPRKSTERKV